MGGELGARWGVRGAKPPRFRPQRTRGVRGACPHGLGHGVQGGSGGGALRFTSAWRTRGGPDPRFGRLG